MKKDDLLLLGAAGVAAAGLAGVHRKEIADVIKRGSKVTRSTWLEGMERYGVRGDPPELLLSEAQLMMGRPVSHDVYALARMIRSEGASEAEARGHVALNDLDAVGWAAGLYDLLTYSTDSTRRGLYGKQYSPSVPPRFPRANKRRYSTARDPYEGDIQWAEKILRDRARGIDPTGGAVKFIDKSAMGIQPGSTTFAAKDAQWRREGLVGYTLPQFGDDLVLYRRA